MPLGQSRATRGRTRKDDAGVSLAELLIAMTISLVVGTLLVGGVRSTSRLFQATDAELTGQTDVRVTIERLGRDLRAARSVDAGATASRLVLWIDSNSDYVKQSSEVVTWSLVASTAGHYDVSRVSNGVTQRTARLVVSQIAFCYRAATSAACTSGGGGMTLPLTTATAAQVQSVSSDIEYDAVVGRGTSSRHTVFTERLRNVA